MMITGEKKSDKPRISQAVAEVVELQLLIPEFRFSAIITIRGGCFLEVMGEGDSPFRRCYLDICLRVVSCITSCHSPKVLDGDLGRS